MERSTIPIAVIIAGVLIAGAVIYLNYPKCPGEISIEGIPEETSTESQVLSPQEIGEKVINFINQNILKGESTASLNEILKENRMYKIKFTIEGQEIETYVTLDGKFLFPKEAAIDLSEEVVEQELTIGNFSISEDEVCKENGKPIVYFFGSEGCGYCKWEHPVMEEVATKFEGEIIFHNNVDSDADKEVFSKYSTGGIPTLVFGCKYYRVGAGTQSGEEKESQYLTALICKLTNNEPTDVCGPVQDLINQVEG